MKLIKFFKKHHRPFFSTYCKKTLRLSEMYFSIVETGFELPAYSWDWFIWDQNYKVNKKYVHLFDLTETNLTIKMKRKK